jgi:hypothetical protein
MLLSMEGTQHIRVPEHIIFHGKNWKKTPSEK